MLHPVPLDWLFFPQEEKIKEPRAIKSVNFEITFTFIIIFLPVYATKN
jgi:hypothetical protein